MSFLAALPVIGTVVEKVLGIVDQAVEDKDKAAEIKAAIQTKMLELDYSALETEIKAQAQVLTAEVTGQSWLQRNWRPITMLCFVFIVVNNYILFPYANLFGAKTTMLDVPPDLWALIKIGLGGYVIGRSAEKIVGTLKNGK